MQLPAKAIALSALLSLFQAAITAAPAILTTPDYNALVNAIQSNSEVRLAFDGVVQFPQPISLSKKVSLDASGHSVTFQGAGSQFFQLTAGADLSISSIAIRGGITPNSDIGSIGFGGAIWMVNSSLTLLNCVLSSNVARGLPGSCSWDGAVNIRTNAGSGYGGAIAAWSSRIHIAGSILEHNLALGEEPFICTNNFTAAQGGEARGGAIFAQDSQLSVERSIFRSNKSKSTAYYWSGLEHKGDGGALTVIGAGPVQIHDSSFTGNSTENGPGGALALHSTGMVVRCDFYSNNSTSFAGLPGLGGAIYHTLPLQLSQSAFSFNKTEASVSRSTYRPDRPGYGGAVASAATLYSTNCAFYSNISLGSRNAAAYGHAIALLEPARAYLTRLTFMAQPSPIFCVTNGFVFLEACAGQQTVQDAISLGFNDPFAQFTYHPEKRLSILRPAPGSPVIGLAATPWTRHDIRGAHRSPDISDSGAFETNGKIAISIIPANNAFTLALPDYGESARFFSSADLLSWSPISTPALENLPPPPLAIPNTGAANFFKAQIDP